MKMWAVVCVGLSALCVNAWPPFLGNIDIASNDGDDWVCSTCQAVLGGIMKVGGEVTDMSALDSTISKMPKMCDVLFFFSKEKKAKCLVAVEKMAAKASQAKAAGKLSVGPFSSLTAKNLCEIISSCDITCCETELEPEQIRLSLTGPREMSVTWSTLRRAKPQVQFHSNGSKDVITVDAATNTYTNGGWMGLIHQGVMSNLAPDTMYTYRVGSEGHWSDWISFTTFPVQGDTVLKFGVVADMGAGPESNKTIHHLIRLVESGEIQGIIHHGDISYADAVQYRWDQFLRKVQPISSRVPYMVVPGNHEIPWNFAAYKARFNMPGKASGSQSNSYYSWDIPGAHFLALNTESPIDTPLVSEEQKAWAIKDLEASKAANPAFTVAYMHRPLYCTQDTHHPPNCLAFSEYLRDHLEDVLNDGGVDLALAGHQHDYERMKSVYQGKLAPSPVRYVVNGAAGCREGLTHGWMEPAPEYSLHRWSEQGFGVLSIENTPSKSTASLTWDFYFENGTLADTYSNTRTF